MELVSHILLVRMGLVLINGFAGLTYGGLYGTYRGLKTAPNSLFKVRMNSIVNQTTRYGPWAANSLGVITLGWAMIDKYVSFMKYK